MRNMSFFVLFQVVDGKFAKEVSHETDGLIFQPVPDVSSIRLSFE